jgi:hypothetical protein
VLNLKKPDKQSVIKLTKQAETDTTPTKTETTPTKTETTTTKTPIDNPMQRNRIIGIVLLNLFLGAVASLFLLHLWPQGAALTQDRTHNFGPFPLTLTPEVTYLIIVACAAVLGSFTHTMGSLAFHKSQNNLQQSFTVWYLIRPFVATILALAVYFAFRGGLMSFGTSASDLNVYGIAAVSAIIGMFSDKASGKLSDVADTLLKSKKSEQKDETNRKLLEAKEPKEPTESPPEKT